MNPVRPWACSDRIKATIPVRCQRCRCVYKTVSCLPEQIGGESTGICPDCVPLEYARIDREFAELENQERAERMTATNTPATIAANHIGELLGEDRRKALHELDRRELEHGIDWRWAGHGAHYTAAGLRKLADGFNALRDEPAALILREEARKLDNPVPTPPKTQRPERAMSGRTAAAGPDADEQGWLV